MITSIPQSSKMLSYIAKSIKMKKTFSWSRVFDTSWRWRPSLDDSRREQRSRAAERSSIKLCFSSSTFRSSSSRLAIVRWEFDICTSYVWSVVRCYHNGTTTYMAAFHDTVADKTFDCYFLFIWVSWWSTKVRLQGAAFWRQMFFQTLWLKIYQFKWKLFIANFIKKNCNEFDRPFNNPVEKVKKLQLIN